MVCGIKQRGTTTYVNQDFLAWEFVEMVYNFIMSFKYFLVNIYLSNNLY